MNIPKIKQEQVVFLRNNDVFSTTVRGVTTAEATGTLAGTDTITIESTPVKNIRSIVVDAVTKNLGVDYTVVYPKKGAVNCIITFTSNQTGDYTVSYDYGDDKIFPDFPRNDLTIDSYPRMAVDVINAPIVPLGIGGSQFISNVSITIVLYSNNSDDLDDWVNTIKDLYVSNANSFYYLGFTKPTLIGPTINSPDKKDEIMQKNIDVEGMFNVDTAA
jgi:hypothetical protein